MGGRKMLKAAALLIALGYSSLLIYQGGVTFNLQESRQGTVQVTELSIETATKINVKSERTKNITLDDVFISVKSSRFSQFTRLPVIFKTWFQLAKNQTWFFTDVDNPHHQNVTNGHMVNTKCPPTYQRKHMCCKMAMEYDYYLESGKKWFCHFDDDNYVNVPRLVSMLQNYSYQEDWYLGKTSIEKPVTIVQVKKVIHSKSKEKSFWFATGGAGFCISRSLAFKMLPSTSGGRFISVCENIRLTDDVSIGFVIEVIVKHKLTVVPEFHSHYEQMQLLNYDTFRDQISFSYYKNSTSKEWNVVNVPGFGTQYDPTRFLSLHCFLFPHYKFCPR